MATMQFDLVSPERRLASLQASEIQIPGAEGDMAAMPGHAPLITTLRPGILKVTGPEGTQDYVVTGGFAEINAEACTVLAERSHQIDEMDQSIFNEIVAEARAKHEAAKAAGEEGPVDEMVKLMADMVALGTHIGLDPNQANFPD
ncbi:F0F1 ATP synthase subunit epsilon [Frigidibacter sp. ROC022]|uniref:F0F1 ATP synthase subunit epsilon n=1 Tax=Frigidibacter sp. ROC022 TaxID=2971796 RepID=UPI00215A7506|nr:F0F1 ATP synthase subunit epsilon [Frigidibacter sp. ROC022]MCR8722932.1 F0F1 ATP synthase subunit epsilon [Frigidibacter sp. ROC022]